MHDMTILYDVIFHYKINAQPKICVSTNGISLTVKRKDNPLTFYQVKTE